MESNLQDLYNQAKNHKDNHKSCGGEPYKSFEKLYEIVNQFKTEIKILEVGTAVGFTTFILQNKINTIDTIELHQEHIDEAKVNIIGWGGDINKANFLQGDAKEILPTLHLPGEGYDIIFFDGYGAKLIFYNDFERLLKIDGLLITANQHLKSTEQEYFNELENSDKWQFIEEFDDTKVYKKLA